MPRFYILAAGAALTFNVSSVSFAYSGNFDVGNPALPVMSQFDTDTAGTLPLEAPAGSDSKPSHPTPPEHAAAKSARDEFQRYFDRHYRAHLVLDASAHGFFEVE